MHYLQKQNWKKNLTNKMERHNEAAIVQICSDRIEDKADNCFQVTARHFCPFIQCSTVP